MSRLLDPCGRMSLWLDARNWLSDAKTAVLEIAYLRVLRREAPWAEGRPLLKPNGQPLRGSRSLRNPGGWL